MSVLSMPGCYTLDARREQGWALDVRQVDETGLPDMSVDPEDGVLTLINTSETARAFHVSLREARGFEAYKGVVTLCVAVPPKTAVDCCEVGSLDISSDIVDIVPAEDMVAERSYAFPLKGKEFVCTQGPGGMLSHFVHASVYYAVDFRCPVGTPVVAIGNGVVLHVETQHTASSIHVDFLFKWNRIVLALDDGAFAEYVHIRDASRTVGERVATNDVIATSGDVGFCPEPHLHLELHLSDEATAPSIPFLLNGHPPVTGAVFTP